MAPSGLRLECPMCEYKNAFISAEALEMHLAHHFKCFPYTCGNCRDRVRFHSEQALLAHYEQSHDPTETTFKVNFEPKEEDLSNMKKIQLMLKMAEMEAIANLQGGQGQDTHEVVYAKCFRQRPSITAQQQRQQMWGGGMMGQQTVAASQRASKPESLCSNNNLDHATSGGASRNIKAELRHDVEIEPVQQPVQQTSLASASHPPPVVEISQHGRETGHIGLEGIEGQETVSPAGNTGDGRSYDVDMMETQQTQAPVETPEAAAKCKYASEKTLTNATTEAPNASSRMGEEGQPLLAEEHLAECRVDELASAERCSADEQTSRSKTSEQREKEDNERKELLAKMEKQIAELRKVLSKYEHHHNMAIPGEVAYEEESGDRSEQIGEEKQSLRRTAEKRKCSNEEAAAGRDAAGPLLVSPQLRGTTLPSSPPPATSLSAKRRNTPPLRQPCRGVSPKAGFAEGSLFASPDGRMQDKAVTVDGVLKQTTHSTQRRLSIPIAQRSAAAHSSASNVPTYPTNKSCIRAQQEEDSLLTEQLSWEIDEAAAMSAREEMLTNATEAQSTSFRGEEREQPRLLAEKDLAECWVDELTSTEQCLADNRTGRRKAEQRLDHCEKEIRNEGKKLLAKKKKEMIELRKTLFKYRHDHNMAMPVAEGYGVESGDRSEQRGGEKQSLRPTAEKRKRTNEAVAAGGDARGSSVVIPPPQKLRSTTPSSSPPAASSSAKRRICFQPLRQPCRRVPPKAGFAEGSPCASQNGRMQGKAVMAGEVQKQAAHSSQHGANSSSNTPTNPTKSCVRAQQKENSLQVRPRRNVGFKDQIGETLFAVREIELALKEGIPRTDWHQFRKEQVNTQKLVPRCDLPEREVADARGDLLPSHDVAFRTRGVHSISSVNLTKALRDEVECDHRRFVCAANEYEDMPLIISRWLIADSLLDRFHQSRLSNTWLTRMAWPLLPEWLLSAMEELEKGERKKHNAKLQFPKQISIIFIAIGLDGQINYVNKADAIERVLYFYRGLRDTLEFVFDYPSTMHDYGPRSVAKYSKEVEVAPGEPDTDFVEKEVRHVGTRLVAITIPEKGDPHIINAIKEFNKQLRDFVRDDCSQSPPPITPMELLDWARLVEERESRGEGRAMATVKGRIQLLAETLRKEYAVTYI